MPITWQNIQAPNFDTAGKFLENAGTHAKGAVTGASTFVNDIEERQKTAFTDQLSLLQRDKDFDGARALLDAEGNKAPGQYTELLGGIDDSSRAYGREQFAGALQREDLTAASRILGDNEFKNEHELDQQYKVAKQTIGTKKGVGSLMEKREGFEEGVGQIAVMGQQVDEQLQGEIRGEDGNMRRLRITDFGDPVLVEEAMKSATSNDKILMRQLQKQTNQFKKDSGNQSDFTKMQRDLQKQYEADNHDPLTAFNMAKEAVTQFSGTVAGNPAELERLTAQQEASKVRYKSNDLVQNGIAEIGFTEAWKGLSEEAKKAVTDGGMDEDKMARVLATGKVKVRVKGKTEAQEISLSTGKLDYLLTSGKMNWKVIRDNLFFEADSDDWAEELASEGGFDPREEAEYQVYLQEKEGFNDEINRLKDPAGYTLNKFDFGTLNFGDALPADSSNNTTNNNNTGANNNTLSDANLINSLPAEGELSRDNITALAGLPNTKNASGNRSKNKTEQATAGIKVSANKLLKALDAQEEARQGMQEGRYDERTGKELIRKAQAEEQEMRTKIDELRSTTSAGNPTSSGETLSSEPSQTFPTTTTAPAEVIPTRDRDADILSALAGGAPSQEQYTPPPIPANDANTQPPVDPLAAAAAAQQRDQDSQDAVSIIEGPASLEQYTPPPLPPEEQQEVDALNQAAANVNAPAPNTEVNNTPFTAEDSPYKLSSNLTSKPTAKPLNKIETTAALAQSGIDPSNLPAVGQNFVSSMIQPAQQAAARIGIDPKIVLAVANLESEYGSRTPKDSNNVFGIKNWWGHNGGGVDAKTKEEINNKMTTQTGTFASYGSVEESFNGFADFILKNRGYRPALEVKDDPEEFIRRMGKRYATDSKWPGKVIEHYRQMKAQELAANS